ncbi:MAG: hypothetical protein AVDCRST_MAG93-2438, partial [uncultured Chloroflexia bacterium]
DHPIGSLIDNDWNMRREWHSVDDRHQRDEAVGTHEGDEFRLVFLTIRVWYIHECFPLSTDHRPQPTDHACGSDPVGRWQTI